MANKKESRLEQTLDAIFAKKLDESVGIELVEKLKKSYPDLHADMARKEAIAAVMIDEAIGGDLAAAKYVYESAKRVEELETREPFSVEFLVVDDAL